MFTPTDYCLDLLWEFRLFDILRRSAAYEPVGAACWPACAGKNLVGLLGGSWVVISEVISRVTIVIITQLGD